MRLSPIDPLSYAMYGTVALSHVVRGDYEQAIPWAVKALGEPIALVHVDHRDFPIPVRLVAANVRCRKLAFSIPSLTRKGRFFLTTTVAWKPCIFRWKTLHFCPHLRLAVLSPKKFF